MGLHTRVDDLLQSVEHLNSIEAQLVLREAYDLTYGIYDHDRDPDGMGLGLVTAHPKELYGEYSPLNHMIYRFEFNKVTEHFGYNLTEFLQLPREFVTAIFDNIAHVNSQSNKDLEKALAAARAAGNQPQQKR